jgi:CubicO group peptidase (beta-lactamase class C family)
MINTIIRAGLIVLCCHGLTFAQSFPGEKWESLDVNISGWNVELLSQADSTARKIGTSSYIVIHHGKIIHSMGNTSSPSQIYSIRKSILNMLFGMSEKECKLSMKSSMSELKISDIDSNGVSGLLPIEKQATVLDLMKSRSGIYHPSAYEDPKLSLKRPARGTVKPGEVFNYNNWDFNALGSIFNQYCGNDVFSAFEEKIAVPLKLQDFSKRRHTHWVFDRALSEHPAYTFQLSTRDMARIGLLMLNKGMVKEKQHIPFDWIKQSTRIYSPFDTGSNRGYGLLWWVGGDADLWWEKAQTGSRDFVFYAEGNYGQYILINPRLNMVIAHKVDTAFKSSLKRVSRSDVTQLVNLINTAHPSF